MRKYKKRESPPRSETMRIAKENGSKLVLISGRVNEELAEYMNMYSSVMNIPKQDILTQALKLFKESRPALLPAAVESPATSPEKV